jgi:sugar phosphate isomerase/epimerase
MEFGISTRCFGDTPVTVDSLERLRKGGFEKIELHAVRGVLNFHNKSLMRGVAAWFQENGLPSPGLHLPFELSVLDTQRLVRQEATDEVKRCLEFTDRLPVDYVVLHLGTPGQKFHPVVFDYAYAAVAGIQAFAGVRVLIETLRNDIATVERVLEFRTAAQLHDVGICYDNGHVELEAFDEVLAVHLNDNDGDSSDDHLWPFEGRTDWHKFIERLALSSFRGPFILECSDDRIEKGMECRSRLQDLLDEAQNSIEEFRLKYKLTKDNP